MPRKAAQNRKGSSRSAAKKATGGEDVKVEQTTPSRKSSSKEEGADGERERSRRSSTAAQTAASVAESRVTRTRTGKQDSSSPSDNRRASGRDVGSESVGRVRSSRRSTGRINYKESDGEEEASTPKNEDTFDSNEEFEDSDSDEKNKSKSKRAAKSPKTRAPKPKAKGKSSGRGRPAKKKAHAEEEEEEEEEEQQEAIDISDDSTDQSDVAEQKKDKAESQDKKEESSTGRKRSRTSAAKPEPAEKPSRKSSRGAAMRSPVTPVSKRPSRNKQIKKYVEVDEDFDEEVKSEPDDKEEEEEEEVQEIKEVKEVSRKRKRGGESESEPSKKPKKDTDQETAQDTVSSETILPDDAKVQKRPEEKHSEEVEVIEGESSDEPMEVDESIPEPKKEKESKQDATEKDKKVEESPDEKQPAASEEPEVLCNSKTSSHVTKAEDDHEESINEGTDDSIKEIEPEESEKVEDLSVGSKDNMPSVIKSPEKEHVNSNINEEKKEANKNAINCVQSSPIQLPPPHDNTFLSREPVINTSSSGDTEKSVNSDAVEALDKSKSFHYQNSTTPKANGTTHGDGEPMTPAQKPSLYSGREYISNKSLSVDLMKELKGNSLCFGLASYNLSSAAIHKDKIIYELDKEVSIVCLQNVSKSLFHDVLESHFDALGFKAVVSWPKDSEIGLATFYKTSLFRLNREIEIPVQKLVQKKLELSSLEENEKSAVSECLGKCGNVLLTQLDSALEGNVALVVANVKIPSSTVTLHALQVACLNQELASFLISSQNTKHIVLCGEFNVLETDIPYLLLRHGRVSEQILDEMEDKTNSAQCAAVMKLLRNVSHHPSLKLNSCYAATMGKELTIPESKVTSPNLLWVSADGIHTLGVVDLPLNYSERLSQGQVPLKADIAVALPFPPKTSL